MTILELLDLLDGDGLVVVDPTRVRKILATHDLRPETVIRPQAERINKTRCVKTPTTQ